MFIPPSELILNSDGSVYHLKLKPGEISEHIITVGDPERVDMVAAHFDTIELTRQAREFKTITGSLRGKRLTVISTGIGTDNIDIVFNELDALVNIDFETRTVKVSHTCLSFYRIGTSGAITKEVPLDSIVISGYAIGFDGLLHFYEEDSVREKALEGLIKAKQSCYAVAASAELVKKFSDLGTTGVTITATGFYGPQSRQLRLKPSFDFAKLTEGLIYNGLPFTNLEMETAGIYGLAALLGHKAVSLNAILANRVTNKFSDRPRETIEGLVEKALEIIIPTQV